MAERNKSNDAQKRQPKDGASGLKYTDSNPRTVTVQDQLPDSSPEKVRYDNYA